MNALKGLLLSTASVLAVAGAQAADLPVKAKPVEYVKICSLYGQGFYYIPGTDTCIKLGGYARAQYNWNANGGGTPLYNGLGGQQTRATSQYATRHRAHFNVDTRTQTAYGTLRTFGAIQIQAENEADSFNVTRAFIQWAGFTFGRTQSFTDSVSFDTIGSLFPGQNDSDTGASGTNQIAYTWELGNGMTLSVGADERRVRSLTNLSNAGAGIGADPASSRGGMQHPNPWVAFKVNQAWGRFSAAVIANRNNATNYTGNNGVTGAIGCPVGSSEPGTTQCHNPDDEWGWAVLTGGEIKTPFIAPKDSFYWFANYGVGAVRYSGGVNLVSPGLFGSGNELAFGVVTDGVYLNGGQIEQTTAWTLGGGYLHWWTNNFSTAVYGGYTEVSYNDTVVGNRWFCGGGGAVTGTFTVPAATSCDPGFNYWSVGSVTNWYPVSGLRLAVDVMYTGIDSAFGGPGTIALTTNNGLRPTGAYTISDQGVLSVAFRAQRTW